MAGGLGDATAAALGAPHCGPLVAVGRSSGALAVLAGPERRASSVERWPTCAIRGCSGEWPGLPGRSRLARGVVRRPALGSSARDSSSDNSAFESAGVPSWSINLRIVSSLSLGPPLFGRRRPRSDLADDGSNRAFPPRPGKADDPENRLDPPRSGRGGDGANRGPGAGGRDVVCDASRRALLEPPVNEMAVPSCTSGRIDSAKRPGPVRGPAAVSPRSPPNAATLFGDVVVSGFTVAGRDPLVALPGGRARSGSGRASAAGSRPVRASNILRIR